MGHLPTAETPETGQPSSTEALRISPGAASHWVPRYGRDCSERANACSPGAWRRTRESSEVP
eukprot:15139523-Alexandrium_andersonii.AAC.1